MLATRHEDRERSAKYRGIGRAILATARDLDTMGEAKYGSGLAITTIHAAITCTNTITVAYREVKATAGEHTQAADDGRSLLQELERFAKRAEERLTDRGLA